MPANDLLQVIVLAAGAARRLGRDKALLPWPDARRPLIHHVLAQFPVERVARWIVVANPGNRRRLRELLPADVELVVNPDPAGDMLSSVRCGLTAVETAGGPLCIHPVDVFALTAELVTRLHEAWRTQPGHIHVPAVGGKRAHPLVLPPADIAAIREIPAGFGLNKLLRGDPWRVVECPWSDPQLLLDLDTPEDYEQHRPRDL